MNNLNSATADPGVAVDTVTHAFTLVHGTFARGAAWTRNDSALVHMLRHRFGQDISVRSFQWSGHNSHGARLTGGRDLAAFLHAHQADHPQATHFVIAHSHGGNVALYASDLLGTATSLAGIACFATPFIACTPRRISAMVTAARLGAPVLAGMAVIAGSALAMIMSARFAGDWIQTAPAWTILLALVLFANLIIRVPLRVHRAVAGLGGMLHRHRRRLYRNLRLPRRLEVPLLVATYSRDEAALWLRLLSRGGGVPFALWNGPSRLARPLRTIRRWGLPALILFGMAGALAFKIGGEKAVLAVVGAFQLVVGVYGLYIQLAIVCAVLMIVVAKILRAHPLGFGWESVLQILLVQTETNPAPRDATSLTVCSLGPPPSIWKGLRHSRVYEEPKVLDTVGEWLERVGPR